MRRVITYEPTAPERILLELENLGKNSLDILFGPELKGPKEAKFRKAANRLRGRDLIFGERRDGRIIFELTDKGRREAEKIKLKFEMAKRRKWDGKWRVFIFDIPEKIKGKRDLLRRELVSFGFMQLQKSVWIYPHPLSKDFLDLWEETGILQHCIVIEASKIGDGDKARDFFFPK